MRASRAGTILIGLASLAVVAWPLGARLGLAGAARPRLLFTFWGMPFEDALYRERYARGYEAVRPGVEVDCRRFGEDLILKYNAWHAVGQGADVMRVRITDYHGMAARGMLEPLDRFIADPDPAVGLSREEIGDFPGHVWAALRVGGGEGVGATGAGRVYALPQDNAQFGLYYNRALFDAHNLEHPDQPVTYPDAGWTWEDLRRAARLLTRRDERGTLARAGIDFTVWSWPFLTFFAQAGGESWSADGLTCLVDGEAGVEALDFLRALAREDRSYAPRFGYDAASGPDALFGRGRTAMYLDGSWRAPALEMQAPELDFAVAPLPRGRRSAVISGSVVWAISSNARHKEEAWRMIRWLTRPEQALAMWDALRVAPPASLRVLGSPAFRTTSGVRRADGSVEVPAMPESMFASRAAWLLHANTPDPATGRAPGFVPVGPYQTEYESAIQRMLETTLDPSSTVPTRAALARVARAVHAVIDRDRAAKGLPPVVRAGPGAAAASTLPP
ncbi:MAG: extracellular solute-binding protein [Phycisphaerae bacterium]|nr:extracellular solute-binding protein [Phycisphaerae bacterium]